ncbi:MAG: ATP phosphoribosyltransferase [Parvibaculales bacterium]
MTQSLIIAVPSKGRLEEKSAEIFEQAGMKPRRAGARGYTGKLAGFDSVEISYLSAGEIAARLRDGSVHFGITGEDLLREEVPDLESSIQLVTPLGFGHADVVVAVPNGWVDVATMADLAEVASDFRAQNGRLMRVATKYIHLTTDYFAAHNVQDIQIVSSFGATEGAPASGAAELIVDITSTGATLAANDLRVPDDGVILKSQANLAASLTADWSPEARQAAKRILARLDAYQTAGKIKQVTFFSTGAGVSARRRIKLGERENIARRYDAKPISHSTQSNIEAASDTFLVPEKDLQEFVDEWMEVGEYTQAIVTTPDFYFEKRNEMFEKLAGALA